MKALKLLVFGIIVFLISGAQAQVSVNINLGNPPAWGPAGYSQVRYYYLPDVESYYDVQTSMFIYFGNGIWNENASLPYRYRNYDLYNGYKVVMTDYRGTTPYTHFNEHKVKYRKGYHGSMQKTIGQKPGKGNSKSQMNSTERGGKESRQDKGGNLKHNNGGGKGKHK